MGTHVTNRDNELFENKLNSFLGKQVKNVAYHASMLDGRVVTVFLDFTDGSTLRIQAQNIGSARAELTI